MVFVEVVVFFAVVGVFVVVIEFLVELGELVEPVVVVSTVGFTSIVLDCVFVSKHCVHAAQLSQVHLSTHSFS